jgi:hypothetical protein
VKAFKRMYLPKTKMLLTYFTLCYRMVCDVASQVNEVKGGVSDGTTQAAEYQDP